MCPIITNFRIGDLHPLLLPQVKSPMGKIIYGYQYLSRMSYTFWMRLSFLKANAVSKAVSKDEGLSPLFNPSLSHTARPDNRRQFTAAVFPASCPEAMTSSPVWVRLLQGWKETQGKVRPLRLHP